MCFYLTDDDFDSYTPAAAYQDVNSNWQTLGSGGRGAVAVTNTRNDDIAYIAYIPLHQRARGVRESARVPQRGVFRHRRQDPNFQRVALLTDRSPDGRA